MKVKSFSVLALVAVAGVVAAVAFGGSQRPLTLQASPGCEDGAGVARPSRCTARLRRLQRRKALLRARADVVNVSTGATAHGTLPPAGKHGANLHAAHEGIRRPSRRRRERRSRSPSQKGSYRACFFIHTSAQHGSFSLDARCFALHASRASIGGCQPRSSPAAPASSARTSATTCSRRTTGSSASTTSRPARSRTSSTSATPRSRSSTRTSSTGSGSTSRSTSSSTSRARPARSTTCGCRCRRSRSARKAPTTRSASPSGKRARFLISSTSEVYGDPHVHPQPETYWGNVNPIGPRGVYDEAKRYAEALTMAYHDQQGVDTAIVRIFNTYGPKMRTNDGRATSRTSSARRSRRSRSRCSATDRRRGASATSTT